MRYLLFFIILFSFGFSNDFYEKDLSSQDKAEVKALNLNDAGDYEQTIDFTKKALLSYPNSAELNMYLATALYNKNNLEEARVFFTKVLSIQPANEQAANFISIIDNQQDAKDNKYINSGLDWLQNKGIDFITVFLGFLAGEMIAKHYMQCKGYTTLSTIKLFVYRREINSINKYKFILQNINIFSKCFYLNIIIGLIAILGIFVGIVLLEFLFKISFLSFSSIQGFTIDEITSHIVLLFCIIFIFYFLSKFIYSAKTLNKRIENIDRVLAQNFIDLVQANLFVVLHNSLRKLKEEPNFHSEDFDLILKYIYNEDIKLTIKRCYDDI